jgi:citronellol/citronellal dehydrogenase
MTRRLEGRRTVVTGASRGIGAGIAERVASEGSAVALVARTLDEHSTLPGSLNETAARCRAAGVDVVTIVADLTDENDRDRVVPEAVEGYSRKRRRLMVELNVHCPVDLSQVTTAMAAELHGSGVRVNTVEPRAAVLSEGADKLVGHQLSEDQIESMEAMCEAALWLCDCGPDHTGNIESSIDLLEREEMTIMNLQGTAPHPNGIRR